MTHEMGVCLGDPVEPEQICNKWGFVSYIRIAQEAILVAVLCATEICIAFVLALELVVVCDTRAKACKLKVP